MCRLVEVEIMSRRDNLQSKQINHLPKDARGSDICKRSGRRKRK